MIVNFNLFLVLAVATPKDIARTILTELAVCSYKRLN